MLDVVQSASELATNFLTLVIKLRSAIDQTQVLPDRLLHRAHVVPIAGESYRLKHQRQAGMTGGSDVAETG